MYMITDPNLVCYLDIIGFTQMNEHLFVVQKPCIPRLLIHFKYQYCVPNVVSVSGLSIFYCPLRLSLTFIENMHWWSNCRLFLFKYIFTLSNKRRSHLNWNIFLWHDVIFTHSITWCNLCACFSSGSKCLSTIDVVCFCKFDMNGSSCLDG